jgi:hypothetical protein
MQIIKEAAPEAYLLSCGNLEASNGTVDCLRISLDIRTHWELIIRASMSLAVRYWMHKRLFINDPDFLVVRGPETSTDKILNRYSNITLIDKPLSIFEEKMPINEARVWSSMTLASGGAIFLGDRIKTLTEKGLALISRFFELHNGEAATPLDLFHGVKLPSMWIRKDKDKVMAIAINWSDEESEFEFSAEKMGIKLPQGHITEKWTQEIFESSNPGNFSFKVPSRDACVFEFKKA